MKKYLISAIIFLTILGVFKCFSTPFTNGVTRFVIGTTIFTNAASAPLSGPIVDLWFDGNANDSSGNGNNATLIGTTSYTTGQNTLANHALLCNANNQGAQIGTPGSFGSFTTQNFSIADWVFFSSGYPSQILFTSGNGDMMDGYYAQVNNTGQIFFISNQAGAHQVASTATGLVSANAWHLIVFTRSGSTVNTFVDGVNASMTGAISNPSASTTIPFTVGFYSPSSSLGVAVQDEFAVWNRVLTATETGTGAGSLFNAGAKSQ